MKNLWWNDERKVAARLFFSPPPRRVAPSFPFASMKFEVARDRGRDGSGSNAI